MVFHSMAKERFVFSKIQGSPVSCIKEEVKMTDHSGLVGLDTPRTYNELCHA